MNSLITESMLRYLYNEMSAEESKHFLFFLENNPSSMEQFVSMKEGMESLSSVSYKPQRKSVEKIITYGSIDGISMQ
jgi:hypothetical protein